MATKLWAIGLVVFITLLTSTAQVLYKMGADRIEWSSILSIVFNVPLIAGIIVYLISAALLLVALKGGELSVLYPFVATSYIWVQFASNIFFNEEITLFKWFGVGFIVLGVSYIGIGSNKK